MHLFLGLSGADHIVEIVKKQMSSQAFDMKRINMVTGKTEEYKVQGVWRPIEFGHYVFPEEHLDVVLDMLGIKAEGKIDNPKLEKYAFILRKAMGLKKIPSTINIPKPEDRRTIFWYQHANILPIGIKEDTRGVRQFENGQIYDQEHL